MVNGYVQHVTETWFSYEGGQDVRCKICNILLGLCLLTPGLAETYINMYTGVCVYMSLNLIRRTNALESGLFSNILIPI